jgi:hypothetical protein
LYPLALSNIVAARTVAVPAGIIAFHQMTTGIADLPMGAEFAASAMFDIIHDFVLARVQPVGLSELIPIFAENISQSWTGFGFIRKPCMAA